MCIVYIGKGVVIFYFFLNDEMIFRQCLVICWLAGNMSCNNDVFRYLACRWSSFRVVAFRFWPNFQHQ